MWAILLFSSALPSPPVIFAGFWGRPVERDESGLRAKSCSFRAECFVFMFAFLNARPVAPTEKVWDHVVESEIEYDASFSDEKVTHRDVGSDDRVFDTTFVPRQFDGIRTCALDRRLGYSPQRKLGVVVATLDSIRESLK